MKLTTLLPLAPLLGGVGAVSATNQTQSQPFTLNIRWSNSPLKGPLNANGGAFWTGKPTASYCPQNITGCHVANTTSFVTRGDQLLLNTVVPGGQQVYISPKGELTYTAPHSAYIPEGSLVSLPLFSQGSNSTSWLNPFLSLWLCDVDKANQQYKVWAEYRNTTTGDVTNNGLKNSTACTRISLEATPYKGAQAWSFS